MEPWNHVKWTEAGQIAERLGWEADLGADARASPQTYFEKLRAEGRLKDAVFFLAQALPRYDTVAWAARAVRDLRAKTKAVGPDADALKATLLWVQDPSDARRRAAFEAAGKTKSVSAEKMVALAAYFSGGSLTSAETQPVQARVDAAGRFAAGAVFMAAVDSGDLTPALGKALDAGVAMATGGAAAGAP